MSNATGHTVLLCPGSGRQALHDREPGIDEPWLGLCPVCRARFELESAGIAPDHTADLQRPEGAIATTPAPESRPAMVVSIEAGQFVYDGTTLTHAPDLLRNQENEGHAKPPAGEAAWIDGTPFMNDGAALTYAPHLLRTRPNSHRANHHAPRVVPIDGAPFSNDGTTLVYTPTEPRPDQQP